MDIHLKLDLSFDNLILFKGFLPESDSDKLNFSYDEGNYSATIYLKDRKTQLRDYLQAPSEMDKLKNWNLNCNSLTMNLWFTNVPNEVYDALNENETNDATEEFGKRVSDIIIGIQNRIIDFCRNILKQHWLEPISINPENYQSFLLGQKTVWLDSSGRWRYFLTAKEQVTHLSVCIRKNGIERKDWQNLQAFLKYGRHANTREVLFANCLVHLDQDNGRFAVVEAIMILESAIKQLLPTAISNLPGSPDINYKTLDQIIEKAGLKNVLETGLLLISNLAGIDVEDINLAVAANNVRNEIIHSQRRYVSLDLARNYVFAVKRIVENFEKWVNMPSQP